MKRVEVEQQLVLSSCCVSAFFAHVQLVASLLVGVLQGDAVDLLHVGLQGAALGEGLLTEGALVRTDSCMKNLKNDIRVLEFKNRRVCMSVCEHGSV